MSLYEQSSSIRTALLAEARERLGVARSQVAVIETVRQTAGGSDIFVCFLLWRLTHNE